MLTNKKERTFSSIIRRWMLFIIAILLIIAALFTFSGRRIVMDNLSMYPTISTGDLLLVDRISYMVSSPARFDIVIFPSRYEEDSVYIRRIIGLPGETVQIVDGLIYINGASLSGQPSDLDPPDQAGRASELITLGADEFFVLCDNRSDLSDSREPFIGSISRASIQGKVRLRAWPLGRIGVIE